MKSCPFCKNEDIYTRNFRGDLLTYVYCEYCDFETAIGNWEQRPIEDALQTEIKLSHARNTSSLDYIEEIINALPEDVLDMLKDKGIID